MKSFHIDFIGLLRLGKTNDERLNNFLAFLKALNEDILIPAFSYDLTENRVFDKLNSPSKVGAVTEWLRKSGEFRRTSDGIFSYLALGDFDGKYFMPLNFTESFGESGILDEFYKQNGEICSVGGVWRHATEIHYLERKLGVAYRFNKDFDGELRDENGDLHAHTVRYFCRKDFDIRPCFRRLEADLKNEGILIGQEIGELYIESAKIQAVEAFLAEKLKQEPLYLCVKTSEWVA